MICSRYQRGCQRESGVVLIVALILLLGVTLIAVSASNIVRTNLKVVQNLESADQVRFAANAALEEAISSDRFTGSPNSIFAESCEEDNHKCYDFNGDDKYDVTVVIEPPSCVIVTPIKNSELSVFDSAADASCFMPPGVYSMCANSVWELYATATDEVTGARITVRQGVSILTTLNNVNSACPV